MFFQASRATSSSRGSNSFIRSFDNGATSDCVPDGCSSTFSSVSDGASFQGLGLCSMSGATTRLEAIRDGDERVT